LLFVHAQLILDCWASDVVLQVAMLQEEWPSLPHLAQKALNSTNQAYEAVSEQELLATIASRAASLTKLGKEPDFGSIAKEAAAGPIAAYAETLGKFVRLYGGGGADFPLMAFLVSFVPSQGKSISLGKDFWSAITDVELSKTNLFSLTRLAMAVTNFLSPRSKVSDGFGRLLSKSDIQQLKNKKFNVILGDMEKMFHAAWTTVEKESIIKQQAFGRLLIRSLLHILKKSKAGHEQKEYESLEAINQKFEDELEAAGSLKHEAAEAKAAKEPLPSLSVKEGMDPMTIAGLSLKLTVGNTFTHKDHPGKVFSLEKKEAGALQLAYLDPISSKKDMVTIEAADILAKLRSTKAKAPTMIPDDVLEDLFPSAKFTSEMEKAKAFLALWNCYDKMDCDSNHIQVLQDGMKLKVFAKKEFKANQLCLIPITTSCAHLNENKPSKTCPTIQNPETKLTFYINGPKIWKKDEDKSGCIAPYWLLSEHEEGQMESKSFKYEGHVVSGFTNVAPISVGQEIFIKKQEDPKDGSRAKKARISK